MNDKQLFADYQKYFSVEGLKNKLSAIGKSAGASLVYLVLLLYYVVTDSKLPLKDRAIIYGALGYFILPVDLIPDAMPIVGFSDDMAAVIAALNAIKGNITPEAKSRARERLGRWFPAVTDKDLPADFR
ncbi:MAG TPA: DUF1232 domain-containing protein [Muribaculum sp.]|jgi:uncharacterized membrane protein YkvA (DUF1232 family)|uniref:DUF1232 domain-containing protein n=1 Tax=Heminiphilus faecis TaxID=2601703 RepID=A0ABV4CU84_9BACT|nr:DUF1232 domain-containing protein [Heminiphilus faecis]RLT75837.1 DUF1232 domain-containing protein [bacterium J10(2018)]HRF69427.1 DUF1232 domain-containing protein [Muribaculum sp.]